VFDTDGLADTEIVAKGEAVIEGDSETEGVGAGDFVTDGNTDPEWRNILRCMILYFVDCVDRWKIRSFPKQICFIYK
jgi:hypothetical protein